MKKFLLSVVLTATFTFSALAQYTDGVFILNEGGAGSDNSSLSFLANSTLQNNVYGSVNNGDKLGDTAQSMGFKGDKVYVVLNISNEVVVANSTTLVKTARITEGLVNPRYIAFYGEKAYVTCWGNAQSDTDDYIAVIDLSTNAVTGNIPVAVGIEKIITIGDKLYVAHKGGYGDNNLVSVVNPATNAVVTIEVGDVPNAMVEKGGFLYVMCGGRPSWSGAGESSGKLVKINLADNTIAEALTFFGVQHPSGLGVNGNDLYYTIGADIYKTDIAAATLPVAPLFSIEPQGVYGIYGFDVIDGKLYIGDAGGFVAPGVAHVYTAAGAHVQTYTVGISPNGFYKSVQTVTGTVDVNKLTVSVYPNPVSEVLYVNTDKQAEVRIFDIAGRIVANENYTASGINVSALPAGTYFAEITVENAKSIKQIVIQ
ncbi:DUF5074 domain-containing protein [Flavobacterium cerinum]|nr:DUF5074 domain-containing protein [Flavobacterium cerinum]